MQPPNVHWSGLRNKSAYPRIGSSINTPLPSSQNPSIYQPRLPSSNALQQPQPQSHIKAHNTDITTTEQEGKRSSSTITRTRQLSNELESQSQPESQSQSQAQSVFPAVPPSSQPIRNHRESSRPPSSMSQREFGYGPPSTQPFTSSITFTPTQRQNRELVPETTPSQMQYNAQAYGDTQPRGLVDRYTPGGGSSRRVGDGPRSGAEIYMQNNGKGAKGDQIMSFLNEMNDVYLERFESLENNDRIQRDQTHEVRMSVKTLATRDEVTEGITAQLSPAMHEFFRSLQISIRDMLAPLPDVIAQLSADKVKNILIDMNEKAKLEQMKESLRDSDSQKAVEQPLISLMNHLITKLDPLDNITAMLASYKDLPQAIQDVAIFRNCMDAIQSRVAGPSTPQNAFIQNMPESNQSSSSFTHFEKKMQDLDKKIDSYIASSGKEQDRTSSILDELKTMMTKMHEEGQAGPKNETPTNHKENYTLLLEVVTSLNDQLTAFMNTKPDTTATDMRLTRMEMKIDQIQHETRMSTTNRFPSQFNHFHPHYLHTPVSNANVTTALPGNPRAALDHSAPPRIFSGTPSNSTSVPAQTIQPLFRRDQLGAENQGPQGVRLPGKGSGIPDVFGPVQAIQYDGLKRRFGAHNETSEVELVPSSDVPNPPTQSTKKPKTRGRKPRVTNSDLRPFTRAASNQLKTIEQEGQSVERKTEVIEINSSSSGNNTNDSEISNFVPSLDLNSLPIRRGGPSFVAETNFSHESHPAPGASEVSTLQEGQGSSAMNNDNKSSNGQASLSYTPVQPDQIADSISNKTEFTLALDGQPKTTPSRQYGTTSGSRNNWGQSGFGNEGGMGKRFNTRRLVEDGDDSLED